MKEALAQAPEAVVDPYTYFVVSLAEADHEHMRGYLREAREYGRTGGALLAYGKACLAVGRTGSARSVLAKAVKEEPYEGEAWWSLGLAHLFARAHGEAAEAFQKALDQSPGDLRSEAALGVARFHQRKYAEAEEHLRRTAGATGLRAATRSMLACSLCMQENWEEARIELNFLRNSGSARWALVADQCLDCVARSEARRGGSAVSRRREMGMYKSLAAVGAAGLYIAFSMAENWFHDNLRWASVPVVLIAMGLARSLRTAADGRSPGAYGNYEQGLPCWQTTTWMKPRRGEF